MGVYYRWNKYELVYETLTETSNNYVIIDGNDTGYFSNIEPKLNINTGYYYWNNTSDYDTLRINGGKDVHYYYVSGGNNNIQDYAYVSTGDIEVTQSIYNGLQVRESRNSSTTGDVYRYYSSKTTKGSFIEYVYSSSSTAYPSSGIQSDYWYTLILPQNLDQFIQKRCSYAL